ncbi:hypothetical protein J2T02_000919 [Chitinophaga terrae (ex Kim and Jung 2007)]|nr:hypothetical protein [Chitinophaga terrae (ex Kim and Jung 2007)]MDQ0105825.1 hypothetical protein [Chitinophaga terrae (ex Kim and Jung 2007)]
MERNSVQMVGKSVSVIQDKETRGIQQKNQERVESCENPVWYRDIRTWE